MKTMQKIHPKTFPHTDKLKILPIEIFICPLYHSQQSAFWMLAITKQIPYAHSVGQQS